MEIKQLVRHLVAVACLVPSIASASIVYSINRTVGLGTVVGFVKTNGTEGALDTADLEDWKLTLTAPNLSPKSTEIIQMSNLNSSLSTIIGKALVASATDLSFDFSSSSGLVYLTSQNDDNSGNNYWCLSASITCNGEPIPAETIGFANGGTFAQTQEMTGRVVIGSVVPVPVPEPASLALVGFGLAGLGLARRRKQQIA